MALKEFDKVESFEENVERLKAAANIKDDVKEIICTEEQDGSIVFDVTYANNSTGTITFTSDEIEEYHSQIQAFRELSILLATEKVFQEAQANLKNRAQAYISEEDTRDLDELVEDLQADNAVEAKNSFNKKNSTKQRTKVSAVKAGEGFLEELKAKNEEQRARSAARKEEKEEQRREREQAKEDKRQQKEVEKAEKRESKKSRVVGIHFPGKRLLAIAAAVVAIILFVRGCQSQKKYNEFDGIRSSFEGSLNMGRDGIGSFASLGTGNLGNGTVQQPVITETKTYYEGTKEFDRWYDTLTDEEKDDIEDQKDALDEKINEGAYRREEGLEDGYDVTYEDAFDDIINGRKPDKDKHKDTLNDLKDGEDSDYKKGVDDGASQGYKNAEKDAEKALEEMKDPKWDETYYESVPVEDESIRQDLIDAGLDPDDLKASGYTLTK